jgi:mannose-1-phosphate guanylyltransferase
MSVFGGKSMLQRTVERVLPLRPQRVLVITNTIQAEESARQLKDYQNQCRFDIIEEPVGRNTAPAIGLAASIIARYDPDGVMLVLPADHYIAQEEKFRETVLMAREAALNEYLVTMGIVPTRPETGYGNIEAEMEQRGAGPYPVQRFVEKPNIAKAAEFLAAGNFYWNSGMFIWRADVILDSLMLFMPELSAVLAGLSFSKDIWELADLRPKIELMYQRIVGESIDFGVMEKADNVLVLPGEFGWSDVGSWSAIPDVLSPNASGNVAIRVREELSLDSEGCMLYGDGKLTALIGVKDLIVVDTADALLVCHRDRAQDVKLIVAELEKKGLTEYL